MTAEERARLIAEFEKAYYEGLTINEFNLVVSELKRVDVLEKALRPFVDNYNTYGNHAHHSHGLYVKAKQALGDA